MVKVAGEGGKDAVRNTQLVVYPGWDCGYIWDSTRQIGDGRRDVLQLAMTQIVPGLVRVGLYGKPGAC